MTDDQQRARQLPIVARLYERQTSRCTYRRASVTRADGEPLVRLADAQEAITAALRAAPEVEVVGEAWRLVNSGGDQVGGLYSSEWSASAAELKYRGNRTRTPYTVQRLEIIAARPQGV